MGVESASDDPLMDVVNTGELRSMRASLARAHDSHFAAAPDPAGAPSAEFAVR